MSGIGQTIWAPLTRKADEAPHTCKLKVYWKTSWQWTETDIRAYRACIPELAEQARLSGRKFTCEDFALELLCRFAAPRGLPVKLTDGVREYRNMDIYDPDYHENYPQTVRGFIAMVMASFGAPDVQRAGSNTVRLSQLSELVPGDILALALDGKGKATGNRAHHIQVVVNTSSTRIAIYQGNSDWSIHKPVTWINRALGRNSADPTQDAYAGMAPETGQFTTRDGLKWDYKNDKTGNAENDYLRYFELYRWNFLEFNK